MDKWTKNEPIIIGSWDKVTLRSNVHNTTGNKDKHMYSLSNKPYERVRTKGVHRPPPSWPKKVALITPLIDRRIDK